MFDPNNLLMSTFTDAKTVSTTDPQGGIRIVEYTVAEPFSGQDVSMAYDQSYKIYGADCYGCDTKNAFKNINIDNISFSS